MGKRCMGFDFRGRRPFRWNAVGLAMLLALACVLLACSRSPAPAPAAAAPTKAAAAGKSVLAVLPLRNTGGAGEMQYFTDGVSLHFARALAGVPGVTVIGTESSFRFRDSSELNSVIGEKLGASHLLRGSLKRQGGTLGLEVELLQASDGTPVWSQTFQRPERELFALQDEVVAAVAKALQAGSPPKRGQDDRPPGGALDAYDAALHGEEFFRGTDVFAARQAVDAFERAVALDPAYAHAHAWLAMARVQQLDRFASLYAAEARDQGEKARRDAATALRLDPDSPDAHRANAVWLASIARDPVGAMEEVRRALALRPGDATLLAMLAIRQTGFGQLREAAETLRQALVTNPLSAPTLYSLGSVYLGLADYPQAEHELRLAQELEPTMPLVRAFLAMAAFQQNRTAEAIDIARQEPASLWRNYSLAMAYWANGERGKSEEELQALIREHASDAPTQIAGVYAQRDDRDNMFHWLDVARKTGDPGIVEIRYMPFISRYVDDPRFTAIVRELELAPDEAARKP